jgi:hypothetical protein
MKAIAVSELPITKPATNAQAEVIVSPANAKPVN